VIIRARSMLATVIALIAAVLSALQPASADTACDAARDAWIEGRLGTALLLNTQLNPLGLELEVRDCVVRLYGTVDNEIARDLALRIANGVDGVTEVRDDLRVTMAATGQDERRISEEKMRFKHWVEDATTTAVVREKIQENRNITSTDIAVGTEEGVVILTGTVPATGERTMAELVVRNVEGVEAVRNLLDVAD
jgi:hyperosmotically inducible periplasmic protein